MKAKEQVKKIHVRGLRDLYKRPGALLITTLIILGGGVLAIMFLLPTGERINSSGYQVVYTASGQAFYGKLKNTSGEYLVLDTPYTAQDIQTEAGRKEAANQTTTLLKVSQQQYGPEDVMSLKADQVVFWQNLRSDSKVAKAIENAK